MNRRARQRDATRERVMAAAKAELEAKGYAGTTIRSVAAAAKVSAGTVLLYFRDKEDLFHSVLHTDLDAVWQQALAATDPDHPRDDLGALFGALFTYYTCRPTLSRELLQHSMFARDPWRERFVAQTAGLHAEVAKRLALAFPHRKDEAPLAALSLVSHYMFALLSWRQAGILDPVQLFIPLLDRELRRLEEPL